MLKETSKNKNKDSYSKTTSIAKENLISACEEAITRHKNNKVNEAGLKLQSDFTYTKTAEKCINIIREC